MPGWLAATLVGAAVLVVVDRLVARWVPYGRGRRRPKPRRFGGSGGGPLGELIAGFQPEARHLWAEEERQRHDLVIPGDADPPWTLDLDAGTADLTDPPRGDVPPESGHGMT